MVNVGGALTLVALFGCGLFFYPWLLRKGSVGIGVLAVCSVTLAVLFYRFDGGQNGLPLAIGMAVLLAVLPVIVAVLANIVSRSMPPRKAESTVENQTPQPPTRKRSPS